MCEIARSIFTSPFLWYYLLHFTKDIYFSFIVEERGVHRVLVGKPEGKRPLGRPRRRLEDNIKMDL
jgi:hypothetical protein